MGRTQPVIVFVSRDPARAEAAAARFKTAAERLGLTWRVRAGVDPIPREALQDVAVSVLVDGPSGVGVSGPADDPAVRRETFTSPDLELEVNKLLARLLGGRDDAPGAPPATPAAPPRKVHTVKLSRETAGRKGKGVTVVSDLPLAADQLKELATKLKNACGTGGTAKDGRIEIQGDHRDRIAAELEKLGYKVKRAGG